MFAFELRRNVSDADFLLFLGDLVDEKYEIAGLYLSGQRDQRSSGVYDDRGSVLTEGRQGNRRVAGVHNNRGSVLMESARRLAPSADQHGHMQRLALACASTPCLRRWCRGWREAPGGFHEDVSTIIVNSGDAPVSLAAFREDTSTIVVNSAGALVSLAAKVQAGDLVFLVNKISKEKQEVRVAYVAPEFEGKHSVGIAFDSDSPNFWRCTRQNPRVPVAVRPIVPRPDPTPLPPPASTADNSRMGARLGGRGDPVKPRTPAAGE